MKQVFTILAAFLLTATVWAQSPEKMSYQAVIRNTSNQLVTNTGVGMQISILQGSASGTAVYVETQAPTTNANGLVSIEIGGGTIVSGNFTSINWANGPYFIKTETDPTGGTSYSITGTSQLLSVPYALHAKTAETVTGGITETDPVFTAWDKSTGISITESQISDLGTYIETETDPVFTAWDKSTGISITESQISDLGTYIETETDPVFTAWDKSTGISITESQISDLGTYLTTETDPAVSANFDFTGAATGDLLQFNGTKWVKVTPNYLSSETDPSVPTGTQAGQMQYWNGTAWVTVAATENEGATLQMIGGVPTWTGGTPPPTPNVTNPTTGVIWMDRNLGASQVATSSTDADAYGDLYQWGRAADGHQIRTSGTTATLATSDNPGHGNFITIGSSPWDWRSPQNHSLWQGVNGINNPCPSGYRLPTVAEWNAERLSWSSNNAAGAFSSPLKLPVAGTRSSSNGTLSDVGSYGFYWSSSVGGTFASYLSFGSSNASMNSVYRAYGFSVRCLKD